MGEEILQDEGRPGSGNGERTPLAQWLEQRCQDERLSYRQAAKKVGVSHATIGDIRKGARPSATIIVKLAEAFGNGSKNQREVLEDHLLDICGYRSERTDPAISEPMARLLDRLSLLNDDQLKAVENIIDFSVSLENRPWRGENPNR